jgi:hypothetical protein
MDRRELVSLGGVVLDQVSQIFLNELHLFSKQEPFLIPFVRQSRIVHSSNGL